MRLTTFFVVYRKRKLKAATNEAMTIEEYVNNTRAKGMYSFSWGKLKGNFDLSDKALYQALFRLSAKGKIALVRRGFYAIITPEYSRYGMLPPHLFIDDLMKSLNKRYYIGLFSAAALHGAAHQQPMEYYVLTEKPALRDIKNEKLSINFYVKKDWSEDDIVQKKTDAGYINVSSPELTALDLLNYGSFGINRIFTILQELSEVMKAPDLTRAARNYAQTTTVQRLGYLLDKEIGNAKLAG
ncbi:MAG TPA: type IV toxin-antitoxin system AbiEi family antitoxin, partial [Anseongella sp.]